MSKIRVAAFDDHPAVRQMLELLIDAQSDMLCVSVWPDTRDLMARVEKAAAHVLVMDISMPGGMDGIEAVRQIKAHFPAQRILMQTVFEDEERIFEAIYAGASGYILKNSGNDAIIQAIRDVHQGGSPMTPSVAARVLEKFRVNQTTPPETEDFQLSVREKEVLSLLVEGLSYKMIAAKLDISFHTVDAHIRKIYEKLHVRSMGEAVSKAIRRKIV
ncbi:MAG: response regulator transcription factor [Bacteroidia bacterium]|nr:response regulator transcription factor [Bacteroidia bacterium]